MTKAKPSKEDKAQAKIDELTADLQRVHADFQNYRNRVETEKQSARQAGQTASVLKLLPVIDTIDRAVVSIPTDIADHKWVRGVAGLVKQLDGALSSMGVARILADPGTPFDPELHQAIQFDEAAEGDTEIIAEELQPGYTLDGAPIRHSMVKVTRK